MKKITTQLALSILLFGSSYAQTNCDIKKEVDKFDGKITSRTDDFKWCNFTKVVKGADTLYFIYLTAEGMTGTYLKKGVTLLFTDGSKIEKNDADFDCKYRAGSMHDYSAFIRLTNDDLNQLTTKTMSDFRLYIHPRGFGEKKGLKLIESLKCLIKS